MTGFSASAADVQLFEEGNPQVLDTQRLWTVIRLRCQPGRIVAPPAANGPDAAALAQHCRTLLGTSPKDRGFRMVVQRPFIVIGDEPASAGRNAVEIRAVLLAPGAGASSEHRTLTALAEATLDLALAHARAET